MNSETTTSKRRSNQRDKNSRILDAAYRLFLEQGFDAVTVQEIAERAGVAKGTFYLYFHDKDDLKEYLITQKSHELFRAALRALRETGIENFEDQIIFVIDYVTTVLAENKDVLRLIAKDLSFGVFNQRLSAFVIDDHADVLQVLTSAAERNGVHLKNPKVLLFMIIELAGSTCFSCILDAEPLELTTYKPYLFDAIRQIIRSQQVCY